MAAKKLKVLVVGAGAFGGWTALHLLRRGAAVTLVDAWGPGNLRASSGGETRIIRGTYGPDSLYTQMSARAMRLWRENEQKWKKKLLHPIGVLFMAAKGEDAFEQGSIACLEKAKIPHERLGLREMRRRWPQINFEGIDWGLFEPKSGYLMARAACQAVVEGFVAEGGLWRQAAVLAEGLETDLKQGVELLDGSRIRADRYVFACGPWMGSLFPETIGERILSTKQDLFFFGTPAGMRGSARRICRCGRIIAGDSCMGSLDMDHGRSRWRTIRAGRSLIRRQGSEWLAKSDCGWRASM